MRTLMNCFWKVRYENLSELFFRDSGMNLGTLFLEGQV